MKTFYTSNFKNIKNVEIPIAISRKPPDWYKGTILKSLCPTWNLVADYKTGKISSTEYEERYKKELDKNGVDFQLLAETLPNNATFLCWETKNKFCHRQLIAKYLNDLTDITILSKRKPLALALG